MILRPEVVIAGDEGFAVRGATEIVVRLRAALAARRTVFVALAGGNTPRPVYRALAEPRAGLGSTEWQRVHFFWSDERLVPSSDPRRNVATGTEDLLRALDLSSGNVHAPRLETSPEAAAAGYEEEIRTVLEDGQAGSLDPPRFDLILLGVGTDGHTASLFPEEFEKPGPPARGSAHDPRLVLATRSPAPPHQRLSFSFELIGAAREVLFLVSGGSKADVVRRVLEERECSLPAARVAGSGGAVSFVLDSEASSRLPKPRVV